MPTAANSAPAGAIDLAQGADPAVDRRPLYAEPDAFGGTVLTKAWDPDLSVSAADAVAIGIINLTIFHWRIFPDCCLPEAGGLTPFKQTSEIGICLNLLVAGRLLIQRRTGLDAQRIKEIYG